MRTVVLLALPAFLAGCTTIEQPSGMIAEWSADWHRVVTEPDRERLRDWRATFVAALAAARKAGHGSEIDREGALLKPDAAIGGGPIPNGNYRCRTIKVGAQTNGLLAYVSYPAFTCRVRAEKNLQRFAKLNGSQRPVGIIFPGDQLRQVFLGTLVLGDERRALQYGQDDVRDIAAFVERIGPNRWRLVMPKPHFESQLDVMELVPLPEEAR
jgi:hypothetical protein